MQQFYHRYLGFMFAGANIQSDVRRHYGRITPGLQVSFHKTDLNNPDAMIVCVDRRDVGHIFGKGIAL